MGFLQRVRNWFGESTPAAPMPAPPPAVVEEEPEPIVREVSPTEVREALAQSDPPLLLDIREPYEWRQVRMPDALHIPMNELPDRVQELEVSRLVIVICAHGLRSYTVAAWLAEQGYNAASLRGGITQWNISGGDVIQGPPT